MRPPSRVFLVGLLAVLPLLALRVSAHAWCVGGAPPALDEDNDGLNDIQERFFGTDPNNADTNGNGVLDGDEDNDHDGIPNKDEPTIFSLEGFVDPAGRVHRADTLHLGPPSGRAGRTIYVRFGETMSWLSAALLVALWLPRTANVWPRWGAKGASQAAPRRA